MQSWNIPLDSINLQFARGTIAVEVQNIKRVTLINPDQIGVK